MKRFLSLLSAVMIAAILFTGCGSGSKSKSTVTHGSGTSSSTQSSTSSSQSAEKSSSEAKSSTAESTTPQKEEAQKKEPEKAPAEEKSTSNSKTYKSSFGYSIEYPASYSVTSLSSEIDFVIADSESGSNINVVSMADGVDVANLSQGEFQKAMADQGLSITVSSYSHTTINGLPAIQTTYTLYEGVTTTQMIYSTGTYNHYVTYTKMPDTSSKVDNEMKKVIKSLKKSN